MQWDRINRVAVLAFGADYERDDVLYTARDVGKALATLQLQTKVFKQISDLSLTEFQNALEEFSPDVVFIVDPFYSSSTSRQRATFQDVRHCLDRLPYPYTGSTPRVSALCRDKVSCKKIFRSVGLKTPFHVLLTSDNLVALKSKLSDFVFPVILKPSNQGSGVGVHLCSNFNTLCTRFLDTCSTYLPLMLEQYIDGIEVAVGVLGRGLSARALPPVELELSGNRIYDYQLKRQPEKIGFYIPARLCRPRLQELQETAVAVHCALGCRGLSRLDFRVTTEDIFCIEINSSPTLAVDDSLAQAARSAGLTYNLLIQRILEDALLETA